MLGPLEQNPQQTTGPFNWLTSVTFKTAVLRNLQQLRLLSFATGVPIGFKNGTVFVDEGLLKRALWTASLAVLWLRALFVAGAICLSLSVDRFWNPFFLPLYLTFLAISFGGGYIGYYALNCEPGCFAMTWNFILKHKSIVKSPKILILFTCIVIPVSFAYNFASNFLLALNPHLVVQFRFALNWALEEGLLTPGPTYFTLVAMATVADFWSAFVFASTLCIVIVSHMLFLETWTSVMNQLLHSFMGRSSNIDVEFTWRKLEELIVSIRIFNIGSASAVFAFKLLLLTVSVSSLSALIILDFYDNLLFLMLICYLAVMTTIVYPVAYRQAYGVSVGLERAKRELLKVGQLRMRDASLERKLGAISSKGVWVGHFRTFERESDLLYLDFIVRLVTSIVLL